MNAIKVDFLIKEFVFQELKYTELVFEVRKDNKSVVNYHRKYECKLVKEDELNYYFELTNSSFDKNRSKFESKF